MLPLSWTRVTWSTVYPSGAQRMARWPHRLGSFEEWDATFHCIVIAAQNKLLASIRKEIEAVRSGPIWGPPEGNTLTHVSIRTYIYEHESLVQAILVKHISVFKTSFRNAVCAQYTCASQKS